MTHYIIYLNNEPLQCMGDAAISDHVGEHFYSPIFRDQEVAERVLMEAPAIFDMDDDQASLLRLVSVEL